ncbi:DMT family transporter [Ensifer adhaerens]|nr:DMT family transporter [Ensifer adhaerens]
MAGAGWLFSIHALAEFPPLLFLGSRFVIAGLLIGLLARFASFAELGRAVRLLLPAALALAVAMMAWIFGLKQTTNPGVAAFITSTGNLLVPVFGLLFFGWPVGRALWISISVALAGMGLLFLGPGARVEVVSALLWAASVGQTQFHRNRRGGHSRDPAGGRRSGHPRGLAACRTDARGSPFDRDLGLVSGEHPDLDLPALRPAVSRPADDLCGAGIGDHVPRTGMGSRLRAGVSGVTLEPFPDPGLRGDSARDAWPSRFPTKFRRLKEPQNRRISEVVFSFEIPLGGSDHNFSLGENTPIDSATLTDLSLSQIT